MQESTRDGAAPLAAPDPGRWKGRQRLERRHELWTQTPNDFYRDWLGFLDVREWAVISYVISRTYGYQDKHHGAAIYSREFVEGRKTADGRRIDRGCNLPRSTLFKVLKTLVAAGLLFKERTFDTAGGDDATFYRLNRDWDVETDGDLLREAHLAIFGSPLPSEESPSETGWGGVSERDGGESRSETPSVPGGESRSETPGVSERDPCSKIPMKDTYEHKAAAALKIPGKAGPLVHESAPPSLPAAQSCLKAAAAACLNIEEGDGTEDGAHSAQRTAHSAEVASWQEVAAGFYGRMVQGACPSEPEVVAALEGIAMEGISDLIAVEGHKAVAYWIARSGGATRPTGFIRKMVEKRAERRPLSSEAGAKGGATGTAPAAPRDKEDWKEERQRLQVPDYGQTQAYLTELRENGTKEWRPEEESGFARMKEAMKGDRSTRAVMDQIEALKADARRQTPDARLGRGERP